MRQKISVVVAAWFLVLGWVDNASAKCLRPWVFFDLGDTIVDTKTNHYNPMFYLRDVQKYEDGKVYASSLEYIRALVKKRYVLGMLIDVPEDWGKNYPSENPILDAETAKIQRMMDFTAGLIPEDQSSWEGEKMDWSPFGRFFGRGENRIFNGRLFLPKSNEERKQKGSLVLFERAVREAGAKGCQTVYIGESKEEMVLAEKAGMAPFLIGVSMAPRFYLPVEEINSYAAEYVSGRWQGPRK